MKTKKRDKEVWDDYFGELSCEYGHRLDEIEVLKDRIRQLEEVLKENHLAIPYCLALDESLPFE